MARKTALIAGAQGLVGRALVQHLEDLGDWDVIGTSRRPASVAGRGATQHWLWA